MELDLTTITGPVIETVAAVVVAALGIVLLLTTIFQVRYGLAPLKRISDAIADIRSGRAERRRRWWR
jgi:hypothetical protein